jgi:hypothetical protein
MTRKTLPLIILLAIVGSAVAAPPPDRISPGSTVEFTLAPDLATLESHWCRTQFAKIYADPAMQAFFNGAGPEMFGLFELPDAIGIKWPDLKAIAGGPIASISIPLPGQQLGTVVAVDVTGHGRELNALLSNAEAQARRSGATFRQQAFAGITAAVWELPDGSNRRPLGWLVKDDLLLVADPPEALGPILSTWADGKQPLAESVAFKSIRHRTAVKAGETADLVWYFDPFGWDASTRPPVLTGKKKRAKDFTEILRQEGFDGVKAIGGSVAFAAGECDTLVRTAVYAPPPRRSALQMLSFLAGSNLKPVPGLPGELAACLVARLDVMTAFESFGGIFDEIAGDGEKGTYKEVIDDLRDNPKGPRVDLRKEIVGQVGEAVTVLSDCVQPLSPTSERAVAVFTVKDEKVVAAAIRRAVEDDPKVKKTIVDGHVVWELISDPPPVKPNEPPLAPDPNAAFCVADGKLYIATQAALIEKLLRPGATRLEALPDYQRVCRQYDRLSGATACVRLFARPDEDLRLTYDMWRKGKLDEATSLYAYGLNGVMPKNPAANNVRTLDGRKLPEYERVSQYLGPVGVMMFVHPDGWDGTAFILPRQP